MSEPTQAQNAELHQNIEKRAASEGKQVKHEDEKATLTENVKWYRKQKLRKETETLKIKTFKVDSTGLITLEFEPEIELPPYIINSLAVKNEPSKSTTSITPKTAGHNRRL